MERYVARKSADSTMNLYVESLRQTREMCRRHLELIVSSLNRGTAGAPQQRPRSPLPVYAADDRSRPQMPGRQVSGQSLGERAAQYRQASPDRGQRRLKATMRDGRGPATSKAFPYVGSANQAATLAWQSLAPPLPATPRGFTAPNTNSPLYSSPIAATSSRSVATTPAEKAQVQRTNSGNPSPVNNQYFYTPDQRGQNPRVISPTPAPRPRPDPPASTQTSPANIPTLRLVQAQGNTLAHQQPARPLSPHSEAKLALAASHGPPAGGSLRRVGHVHSPPKPRKPDNLSTRTVPTAPPAATTSAAPPYSQVYVTARANPTPTASPSTSSNTPARTAGAALAGLGVPTNGTPAPSHTSSPDTRNGAAVPGTEDTDEMSKEEKVLKSLVGVDENVAKTIMNEIVVKGDPVRWEDIAGLEAAKRALKETVIYPFLRPDLFSGLREPARGMLLFGPPGTGKTMLARAVATQAKSTFFSISASSLTSKYLGESEKLVRALFTVAKAMSPSIIFVDEIDSLMSARKGEGEHESSRRLKTEFLIQWSSLASAAAGNENDEEQPRVLVLAATNLPWDIDEAARRRFVRRQYIPLPEPETRMEQLNHLLRKQKHGLTPEQIAELVELTDGYSGSDITALAKDAAMGPLRSLGEDLLTTPRDQIRPMSFDDFRMSLSTVRPSVSKEGLKEFEKWDKEFGSR
ncbi:hypothetical protein YB2330_001878 [Saitoella coloradoensis]